MYSNLFVCVFGIGTVFFGLICLILLTTWMSVVCRKFEKPDAGKGAGTVPVQAAVSVADPAKQQELEVAAAAVIAEELGVKIDRIRIISMKKI